MPTQIKPLRPEREPQRLVLPKGFEWLRNQPKDPSRYTIGTQGYRPDSMGGGFGRTSIDFLARWQHTGIPDPPRLTQSILNGRERNKTGALMFNMLDPDATLSELTGSFIGREQPLVGSGGEMFDPIGFLKSKGITLEGTGETGVPVNLLDYAGPKQLVAVGEMLTGAPMPEPSDPDMPYRFQRDPMYWAAVSTMEDDEIDRATYRILSQVADPTTNQYLYDELRNQLKRDRDKALGYSSGNVRNDYLAKTAFWYDKLVQRQGGVPVGMSEKEWAKRGGKGVFRVEGWDREIARLGADIIPFFGTELAELAKPITPEIESAWREADPAIREAYLTDAGYDMMAADVLVGLKLGMVAGAAASAAKSATGVAGTTYKVYSMGLKASKVTMAAGLTGAMTNWALEAYWPEDFDLGPITGEGVAEYTKRVDLAHPFASSYLAGVVNAYGFWSSATYGAATAVVGGKRLAGAAGRALRSRGVPVPMPGIPARRILTYGFGGPAMNRYAAESLGLNPQGLVNSQRRTLLSELTNMGMDEIRNRWTARLLSAQGDDALSRLGFTNEQIAELASMELSRPLELAVVKVELYTMLDRIVKQGSPILDDFEIRAFKNAVRNLRSLDDAVAQRYVGQYGAEFITRVAGQDTPEAIHAFLTKLIRDLGGTPEGLPDPTSVSRDLEWWHQLTRQVYEYAYDRWAGLVHTMSEGTDEFTKLGVVKANHAWKDLIDESVPILRRGGEPAAQRMAMLEQTIEVEEFISRGRLGKPEWKVTAEEMADFLEDYRSAALTRRRLPSPDADTYGEPLNQIHKQIEDQGLWELAYKPVDDAGEYIASIQTRTGQVFHSRWVEYPLSNASTIEMGNRGFLMQKLEGLTQGYRTWRILEYQKGALFRSLSGKGVGTPTQIADFHRGVMLLSRKHALSPQAVGRAPTWVPGMQAMADEVDSLATKVFGKGPHLDKRGKPIDWRKEIGDAYRTAYRLNLTTGLTSALKAGPGGQAITLASDFIYVAWRFGLSPLFKGGELWESFQLALMRRVNPYGDPSIDALYYRTGIGNDPATIAVELQGDMLLQSMQRGFALDFRNPQATDAMPTVVHEHTVPTLAHAADRRSAASLSFMSRFLYEDVAAVQQRLALKAAAERFRERALGGQALRSASRHEALTVELADLIDDAGYLLPGSETRAREILSELDFEELDWPTRAALERWPEGGPSQEALDRAAALDGVAASLRRQARGEGPLEPWRADPHAAKTELVPVAALTGIRAGNALGKTDVAALAADIRRNGVREPLILEYSQADNTVKLAEGNHRLAAASSLGLTNLPVRVVRRTGPIGGTPVSGMAADVHGYVPADLTPSQIGLATDTIPLPTEAEQLAQYEHLIDEGMLPKDPQIELRKRFRATIDEIDSQFGAGYRRQTPQYDVDRRLLVDPVTGIEIPEFAGDAWPAGRDVDRVLRSLRSRMGKVRVDPPSFEDMALRVEARAEALRSPVPVTRNARVGIEPPEGYTLDPYEVSIEGVATPDRRAPWIDPTESLPEERGMWHTTTNMDAVLDTGLLSKVELIERVAPADALAALRELHARGATHLEWYGKRWDGTIFHMRSDQWDSLAAGRRVVLSDSALYGGDVPWDEVRVLIDNDGNVIWQNRGVQRAPGGLGASSPDRLVSTTTDWNHAETIASRYMLLSRVAHGKADAEEIVGHFSRHFDELGYEGEEEAAQIIAALGRGIIPNRVPSTISDADDLMRWVIRSMDENAASHHAGPERAYFDMVKRIDSKINELGKEVERQTGQEMFTGGVLLVNKFEDALAWDPAQIGTVRVAIRSNRDLPPLNPIEVEAAARRHWEFYPDDMIEVQYANGHQHTFNPEDYKLVSGRVDETSLYNDMYGMGNATWTLNGLAPGQTSVPVVGLAVIDNDGKVHEIIGSFQHWATSNRLGPDQFEIQAHSSNVFVIDDRITAEPLALDELGLLRQHRQTIDDNGNTIPGLERRQQEVDDRLMELKAEAIDPDPATSMSEVYGTPEHFTEVLFDAVEPIRLKLKLPSLRHMGDTFWNPVEFKESLASKQVIQAMREEFPLFLPGTDTTGPRAVFRKVAGAEKDWADWLVKDRELFDRWHTTMDPDDLDALVAHAGGDSERRAMDAMYASEEWATISSLWALNGKAASEEAFGTHFFDQYRSPLLRSINHPVLGIYPASWALKTAREWVRFLFDNRMFGVDLRLGMSPAIAIANIQQAQATAFAMQDGAQGDLNSYLEDGPLGSTLFIFNLLMPGDWSSIPFPLSRTLREIVRGNWDASQIIQRNIDYLGVTRDNRLFWESMGEIGDLATGAVDTDGRFTPAVIGPDGTYAKPRKPPRWTEPDIYGGLWSP